MGYAVLDHTADLGLELEGGSLEDLFGEALRGFTDCLTEVGRVRAGHWREIALTAAALDLLLVDWLQEALYLFETEGVVFCRAELRLTGAAGSDAAAGGSPTLRGRIGGETFDPDRHPLKVPIKAVTYHGLEVGRTAGIWRARVIFDI